MALVSFSEAETIGDRFLTLLRRYGIDPPNRSNVESELLSLTELVEIWKNPDFAKDPQKLSVLRAAAAVHDLAAKILSVENIPEFKTFVPHLRLLAKGTPTSPSVAQNTRRALEDDGTRKLAELYLGCLAAHVGTGLELDSPTNPKGDNPDVLITLVDGNTGRSVRWALAVKTIGSGRQGQTVFDRIAEAAEQINSERCRAERGLIVINTKNAIDHDALWGASFSDLDGAIAALTAQVEELIGRAAHERPQEEWDGLFRGRAVRPVLYLAQSLVALPTAAADRTPTSLKVLLADGANGLVDVWGGSFARLLNEFMQKVSRGIPGSLGALPM